MGHRPHVTLVSDPEALAIMATVQWRMKALQSQYLVHSESRLPAIAPS